MAELTDRDVQTLLAADPPRAWRAFIDRFTVQILAQIERAGVTDRDEAMEVYVRVCERLSEDDCARLRRRDPARGSLHAWLGVVVRHVVVDWIRSRAGRRRLFGVVRAMDAFDRRVFELYYWENRMPAEIAEVLGTGRAGRVTLADVLDALDRIDGVLTERHRSELLSMALRSRGLVSLDEEPHAGVELAAAQADPETRLQARQADEALRKALASLEPQDAALVRLKVVQGLSYRDIGRALHLARPAEERMREILGMLRRHLEGGPGDAPTPGPRLAVLNGGQE